MEIFQKDTKKSATNKPKKMDSFISKYKPHVLEEYSVISPEVLFIVKTLNEMNDLNILLVGNPCCGKTTLLYTILRNYYNTLSNPEEVFRNETNVMFVNNLKEQGINFYRNEMKTFCQSHCSVYGKKKIVIIDDIDNINEQCQQVFRNYIDKYKHNVHFMAVCTNIQKVIESIQSRLHIINIPPMKKEYLYVKLNHIIEKEKINVTKDAKEYLINISNNSVRLLINNIEKVFICRNAENDIFDVDKCTFICSTISTDYFIKYINLIKKKKVIRRHLHFV